ncbi:aminotransferase class I/II-fold pyridoxal phosphate-dependent enzyme [Aliifodinibius salicampi]|uniref:Aminotransferase class I/II-fold pyridoxal phosphate-dependent enzyme n=1 Tax=Fodinibius salicampi TaxID=1920655 RepID=A0ABT3PUK1_9BACT|nr:GntG family PLP-dependent aldolase [Fodinibius salicampi]MCW9711520.1 aminotransferase class I/II-fold pyridoxal phosphate-dependent enzyme [Fodinibius salicampi]
MIDLRSDTVTKPTTEMRKVIADAEVGDDVFGEDPSANALEEKVARMFGFEAGLFVPSGTMGNQLSIKVLTDPGEEVLIEEAGHIINYESTAAAHLSSVQLTPIRGDKGKISVDDLQDRLRGTHDWEPRTKVLSIENSTNKGGGCCYTEEELLRIRTFADKQNLVVHLDGARIWNAMIATGTKPEFYGSIADTMSVCFSKGLGAPVGSMVLSTQKNIDQARRMRKMWGGGMRQIGMLAAAAGYAIEEHLPLLQEDHRRARELAETIEGCSGFAIGLDSVETNILIFDVLDESAVSAVERLEEEGIRLVPFGPNTLRATFHFQITDQDLEQVQSVFETCFG